MMKMRCLLPVMFLLSAYHLGSPRLIKAQEAEFWIPCTPFCTMFPLNYFFSDDPQKRLDKYPVPKFKLIPFDRRTPYSEVGYRDREGELSRIWEVNIEGFPTHDLQSGIMIGGDVKFHFRYANIYAHIRQWQGEVLRRGMMDYAFGLEYKSWISSRFDVGVFMRIRSLQSDEIVRISPEAGLTTEIFLFNPLSIRAETGTLLVWNYGKTQYRNVMLKAHYLNLFVAAGFREYRIRESSMGSGLQHFGGLTLSTGMYF